MWSSSLVVALGLAVAHGATNSTILDIAVATDDLSTLVAAVTSAGLGDALAGDGPLTVFAPTNDAFDALPEGALDTLLANATLLTDVLLYHVVEGSFFSYDLEDGTTVPTLFGDDVSVSIDGSTVMINEATVVQADVEASNGVVHIIDGVLLPSEDEDDESPSTNATNTTMPDDDTVMAPVMAPTAAPGSEGGSDGGGGGGSGSSKKKKSSKGLSGGEVAAIVICVIVAVVALFAGVFFYNKKSDTKYDDVSKADSGPAESKEGDPMI